jgi:hypothetical protein
VARPRHPNKEIENAVTYAESKDWRWRKLTGHGWGELLCPMNNREGCRVFVYQTPKSPEGAARSIVRAVERCVCGQGAKGEHENV